MAVERGQHGARILATQRFAEHRRMAHVGRRLDLGDRDRHAVEIGIANLAAGQDVRQRMTQQLAHAQLALRGPAFARGGLAMTGHLCLLVAEFRAPGSQHG